MLSKALGGLSTAAKNIDVTIDALSDLEVLVQNYADYDAFLAMIEGNADGALKNAASTLRAEMQEMMDLRLTTYDEAVQESGENLREYLMSDWFVDLCKNMPEYQNDVQMQKILGTCSDFFKLKQAWEAGAAIGMLAADAVVGGKMLISRLHEMIALHEISVMLQTELLDLHSEFLDAYASDKSDQLAEQYISFSNYLISARLRGEYCLYSVVATDAGLWGWLHKENREDAATWYERQHGRILEIKEVVIEVTNQVDYDLVTDVSAYLDVLTQYEQALANHLYSDVLNGYSDDWDSIGNFINMELLSASRYYKNYGNQYSKDNYYVYYALSDINNDNINELFVGAGRDLNSVHLYDVFSHDGNNPVLLFDGLGYRTNLTVYNDNSMAIKGSSSYDSSYVAFYNLPQKSCVPVFIEEFGTIGGQAYYIDNNRNKSSISQDQHNLAFNESCENIKDFRWIQMHSTSAHQQVSRVEFKRVDDQNAVDFEEWVHYAVITGTYPNGTVAWEVTTEKMYGLNVGYLELGATGELFYYTDYCTIWAIDITTGNVVWANDDVEKICQSDAGFSDIKVGENGDLFLLEDAGGGFLALDAAGKTLQIKCHGIGLHSKITDVIYLTDEVIIELHDAYGVEQEIVINTAVSDARMFVKNVETSVNLREFPQHESRLEGTMHDDSVMYFYGEIVQGLGSDGVMHDWYEVEVNQDLRGWVRSDLIKEVFS